MFNKDNYYTNMKKKNKKKKKKKKKGRIQARDRPRTIYYLGWAIRTLNFYNCIETR
jgi:hypothetical protein